MKELVIISGKGGTGKTSLVASLAALAEKQAVLADCDVDAADLHLVLEPRVLRTEEFSGGSEARVKAEECIACGKCQEVCTFGAVHADGPGNGGVSKTYRVDPIACEGCGVCAWFCPAKAIAFEPVVNGQWFVSQTRHGPMVHARLGIAQENSGKLVNTVRTAARELAEEQGQDLVLIDGSPGIGCPVIASIAGASLVLLVTEPTQSGLHDLKRVAELAKHFKIPAAVCVNKHDLNPEMTEQIRAYADEQSLPFAGTVPYDPAVTQAQLQKKAVVEYDDNRCREPILAVWRTCQQLLA